MTVCSKIKTYARRHEHVADLSSILAIALLFGSIWGVLKFQKDFLILLNENLLLYGSGALTLLILDILLIFILLNIGSTRFSTAEGGDERCFGTFRGRRHGGPSLGHMFRNWVHHMEHVSKKHR